MWEPKGETGEQQQWFGQELGWVDYRGGHRDGEKWDFETHLGSQGQRFLMDWMWGEGQ